jgi:hypothetical protein
MANFSKYLGKDERVLNSIDMKDETIWTQNNVVAAEFKSWTTLVITNKRFFSLNNRRLSMREFRLEDVVSTGWVYRPQWGRLLWAAFYCLIGVSVLILSSRIGNIIVDNLLSLVGAASTITLSQVTLFVIAIGILCLLFGILHLFAYFYSKRTTFMMTTKDGREHVFLLRGRSRQIDEFRMAVQDAKDLYIEENENRYFDKMRTALFDQSNYEYALNNARPKENALPKSKTAELDAQKEEYLIREQKASALNASKNKNKELPDETTKKLGSGASMFLDSDGTLLLETGGAHQLGEGGVLQLEEGGAHQLGAGGAHQLGEGEPQPLQLKSSASLAESTLRLKAMDLFEKMGFEATLIEEDDADLLLLKDDLRYAVVMDANDDDITKEEIEKAAHAKTHYKTDLGVLISMGGFTDEIKEYADKCHVKIIRIQRKEDLEQF